MKTPKIMLLTGISLLVSALAFAWLGGNRLRSSSPEEVSQKSTPGPRASHDRSSPVSLNVASGAMDRHASSRDNFEINLDRVLHRIEAEQDPQAQEDGIHALVQKLIEKGHASALDLLDEAEVSPRILDLKNRIVRDWTDHQPEAAASWAEARMDDAERETALESVAIVWANREGDEVLTWAANLQNAEDRFPALTAIAFERVRSNPLQALELAVEMDAENPRDDLIGVAVSEWASSDPQASMKWALSIEDPELYDRVVASVAQVWGSRDPKQGATLTATSLAPGSGQNRAAAAIAQRWGQSHPAEALDWVDTFPEGKDRDYTYRVILEHWFENDPPTARQWVRNSILPPEEKKVWLDQL